MYEDDRGGKVIAFNVILAGVGILSIISLILPQWHLWGLDYVGYLPGWLRLALVGGLVALCIPFVDKAVANSLNRLAKTISVRRSLVIYAVMSGGIVLLFILFRSHNHFLGDGYVIQGTISQGNVFSPTEPLDYFLHHLVFLLIGGQKGAYLSYALVSYLSGAAFILVLFLFLKEKPGFIFSLAVAFCFGMMQFFFGYVENYTIATVLIMIYLLSGWRDLSEEKVSFVTVISLVLAISLQINSAIFLVSLGYLYLIKVKSQKPAILWAIAFSGLCVLGILYLRLFTRLNIFEIVVPPAATAQNPYSFFSGSHFSDLLNILFLNFPLLLICPLLLKGIGRRNRGLLLWTVIPALLFVLAIDPRLGAPRDWDMLSLPSAPIMAFILTSFSLEYGWWNKARYGIIMSLALFAFLHTGSWIGQNNSKEAGYVRLKPLVKRDPHYSVDYFQGYRNKSWSNIVSNNIADTSEVIRANEVRYRGAPNDTLNTCNLANYYYARKDTANVLKMVADNWQRFSDNAEAVSIFGTMMLMLKHYPEAEKIYGTFLGYGKIDPRILHNIGAIKELQGKSDSAYTYYCQAFDAWPDAPPGVELSFYLKCLVKGYSDRARQGLKKIITKLPDYAIQPVTEIIATIDTGNVAKAESLAVNLDKQMIAIGNQ